MILAIDGNGLIHTMWHITRQDSADAVERVLNRLEYLRDWAYAQDAAAKLVVVCDPKGKSFRRAIYPQYKAQRTKNPGVFECLDHAQEAIAGSDEWELVIPEMGYEADDCLASIAYQAECPVWIHSADKDFNQCLGKCSIIKKSAVVQGLGRFGLRLGSVLSLDRYTQKDLVDEFGIGPSQWIDYQCLVGDSADNVKGADGIGPMTARHLLSDYQGPLEQLVPEMHDFNARQLRGWGDFLSRLDNLRAVFTLRLDCRRAKDVTETKRNSIVR